jgi:hypothetical protein
MENTSFNLEELKKSADALWGDLSDKNLYDKALEALKPVFLLTKSDKYRYSTNELAAKVFVYLKWNGGILQQHHELILAMLKNSSKEMLMNLLITFLFLSNLSLTEMQKRLELLFVDYSDWNIHVNDQAKVCFDTSFLMEQLIYIYYNRCILLIELSTKYLDRDDPDYENKERALNDAIQGDKKDIGQYLMKKYVTIAEHEKQIPSDVFFEKLFNGRATYDLSEDIKEIDAIMFTKK